jgi:signal transduction histidine kinase
MPVPSKFGQKRPSRRSDGPTQSNFLPALPPIRADPGEEDLPQLIARLAEAEAALEGAMSGRVDAIVHGSGYSYLLHEAQEALVHTDARAKDDAALLEAVLRSAPDLVIYVDLGGTVRWANQSLPEIPFQSVIGAHWLSHVPADQFAVLNEIFNHVVATGQAGSLDGPGLIAGGATGWRSRRIGPVRREGKVVGVVVVSRDLTDSKNAEVQLMISDRMASLGTLAAGMAHEINNPLATVIGNLGVALEHVRATSRRPASPAEMQEIIEDALTAADRIRSIVRDLRLFSRSPEDKSKPVDLESVIDSALRMARNETRHRAHVLTDFRHVRPVAANESRLGQVFLNLIVNAAQAIPEGNASGNTIAISTFETNDGRAVVKVSDSGPGIPPDIRKNIFTPFFTTKPIGIGTGLGLSICHRIVTSLGGDITFNSELGKGTEFVVSLPLADTGEAGAAPSVRPLSPPVRQGRVLVIDDEPLVCDTVSFILSTDHAVVTADSGAAALTIIAAGERFDVILCDLMMPQMTGMEFFAALTTLDPTAVDSVVFMTGGAFMPRARNFLTTVRNNRVEKPFDLFNLRALINGMIR